MSEAPQFRAVNQLDGTVVDPVTAGFAEAQRVAGAVLSALGAAERTWETFANKLIERNQSLEAGAAIAREKAAELECTVEGLGQRIRELEQQLADARNGRDTANAINGGQR